MNKKKIDWSVYLVTDRLAAGDRPIPELVRQAIAGGVTAVQLREKALTTRKMLELGQVLLEITRPAGVPLIINDRIDVALALDADGVHLGQDDLPVDIARKLIGLDKIVGISAATIDDALEAERLGADYLGTGDIFGTPSKADAGIPIGLTGLSRVIESVSIPVVAIGGITLENAALTIKEGAAGVAVISAILRTSDPEAAARNLRSIIRLS